MKKSIFKEFDRSLLGVDIMLYCVIFAIGYILLYFSELNEYAPTNYFPSIFYLFGFFTLLAYFVNRRENDYEYLIFGLINIVVASFLVVNNLNPNSGFIFADALLIYTLAYLINRSYHCRLLARERNINFFPKLSITILIAILGIYTTTILYTKAPVANMIMGYYFIAFGLISLIEPLIIIIMRNPSLENNFIKIVKYDKSEKVTKTRIKEAKERKPIAKDKIGEIKEDNNIASKPKKKKNKKTNK